MSLRVGLISDTHGLLRPQALEALRGSDHIIHGGDIGSPEILDALRAIAPLTVVRGNNDRDAWARDIPELVEVDLGGVLVCAIHDLKELASPGEARVVVSGHSHRPSVVERAGVIYINPGSAGPRRFKLPVSVAELVIAAGELRPRLITLPV